MDARPRPRFERHTPIEVELLRERLKNAIHHSSGALRGEVLDHHAQIMIGEPRRHTWSPCLSLSYAMAEGDAAGRLRIRGFFGPHPALWTMIATLYAVSAFIIFIGAMVGSSQWFIGRAPSAFLAIPVGVGIMAVLYIASLSGQALAQEQMNELLEVLDQAIDEPQAPV